MPTVAHESAVSKLRDHPDLLSKLVRKVFHAALDPHLKPLDATPPPAGSGRHADGLLEAAPDRAGPFFKVEALR